MEFVTGCKDHNQIVKGKRTKRQRSLSPFGVAAVNSGSCSSSGYSGGGGGGSGGGGGERGVVYDDCCYNSVVSSSPTTSGEIYESTEEEEDMANCLIMLAQGEAPARHRENMIRTGKFTSKKFSGVATTSTTNKAGFYVYECKTCNRSFPSFQALGGHRASHKRPKAAAAEDQKKPSMVFPPLKDELEDASPPPPPPPLFLQAGTATKAGKIHECSICGSEFTSGQALGGHMRRHRAATPNNQVVLTSTSTIESNSRHHHDIKPRSILPTLDLNLPAPEDDHLRDSKFQFGSSTQQAHSLVFSAPALVDCHY